MSWGFEKTDNSYQMTMPLLKFAVWVDQTATSLLLFQHFGKYALLYTNDIMQHSVLSFEQIRSDSQTFTIHFNGMRVSVCVFVWVCVCVFVCVFCVGVRE